MGIDFIQLSHNRAVPGMLCASIVRTCAVIALISVLCVRASPQVHRGGHHRDGGRDVRGLLRGRLHRPSPGSRLHGALRPQLSQ